MTVDATASHGSAAGTIDHAALEYECSKPHLQLLERHLIFSFGRGRRHNVKTVEIASAVSMSHEVAVCVLLNINFSQCLQYSFETPPVGHCIIMSFRVCRMSWSNDP